MARTPKQLTALGFRYDAAETYRDPHWPHQWRGLVVPIASVDFDGQEYEGFAVTNETKKGLDADAVEYAADVAAEIEA